MNTLRKQFEKAVTGMAALSETGATVTVISAGGPYTVMNEGVLLEVTGESVDTGITVSPSYDFFEDQIEREFPDMDRWVALQSLFANNLTQFDQVWRVYGPGSENPKRLYILGLTPNGSVLGIKTEVVET